MKFVNYFTARLNFSGKCRQALSEWMKNDN